MKLVIADDQLWNTNWDKHSSTSFPEGVLATEQDEQEAIEDEIARVIGDDYSLGFDWIVQHFDTPRFIFTITLQNADLFRRDIIEPIIIAVTTFSDRWKLNLGLVDSIHEGVWDSIEDCATLFFTQEQGLILRHQAYEKLDRDLRNWLDELTTNR